MSVALVAAARSASAEPEDPQCNGAVDVHAVDASTHQPVVAATVRIASELLGTTDETGHFLIADLCPATMTVIVERDDYNAAEAIVTVTATARSSVEIEMRLGGEVIEVHERAPDPPPMQSSTEVSGAALERSRGKSFTAAIAEVPGVTQLKSATGVAKPIIRGQFGRRLLLLVDGVRHRAQEWGLEHAPEVDPFVAEKIRVVRGAGGVRYGSDAIGGVVLVDPAALRREPGYNGELHLIGMSNGRGGSIAGRVQGVPRSLPKLSTMLEGSIKRSAALEAPDYALDNTGAFEWSAGATVDYDLTSSDYKLSYRRYQAELGVCACLRAHSIDDFLAQARAGTPVGADEFSADFAIDRPKQQVVHDTVIARGSWVRDKLGRFTSTFAFQHDLRREYDVVRNADEAGAQYNFRLNSYELDGVFEHNPIHLSEHWHLRGAFGLSGLAQAHHYAGLHLVPPFTSLGAGAYAIERLIGHDVELELGARYDLTSRTAEIEKIDFQRLVRSGQLADGACGADIEPAKCSARYHTFTASSGALWRFAEPWSIRGELSVAQRAPNTDEQYLNGAAPTFPVLALGKPDLGPETTYGTSLTLGYAGTAVKAEASGFVNRIDDYIYFAPAIDDLGQPIIDTTIRGAFPRFTTRPIPALFFGADGGISAAPIKQLDLGAQVSLVRARNRATDGPLVLVPADHFRGSITYRPPDRWPLSNSFVTVTGTYVARKRGYDPAADFIPPPAGYFALGAEIGTETCTLGNKVKIALQGANLTNARYRDYTSLMRYYADEPGWQLWLRASVFFDSRKEQ
ncbi:MAG: TonB-dependent receptor [Myxococcales bacterium]|nr:TonB-dependent receptor [Myxococcales bacterium]